MSKNAIFNNTVSSHENFLTSGQYCLFVPAFSLKVIGLMMQLRIQPLDKYQDKSDFITGILAWLIKSQSLWITALYKFTEWNRV